MPCFVGTKVGSILSHVRGECCDTRVRYPQVWGTSRLYGDNGALDCTPSATPEDPRLHGDKVASSVVVADVGGISQDIRGQLPLNAVIQPLERNNPAYMGRSRQSTSRLSRCCEYPRIHGDNYLSACDRKRNTPCVWGQQNRILLLQTGLWSTPAFTGKTRIRRCYMRFKRNTPVCTGTTTTSATHSKLSKEYPRVYGDNAARIDSWAPNAGIPPCVRGVVQEWAKLFPDDGIPPRTRGLQDAKGDAVGCTRNTPAYTVGTT